MSYEETSFIIDNDKITFKRNILASILPIGAIVPFIVIGARLASKDSTAFVWFLVTSVALIILLYRSFSTIFKTTILLADIAQIEVSDVKDGKPAFKGSGKRNFFPAGLNK